VNTDPNLLQAVFQLASEDHFYVPFIQDQHKKTAAHYSFSNSKITDVFLENLKNYPLSFYSENMVPLVPYIILK